MLEFASSSTSFKPCILPGPVLDAREAFAALFLALPFKGWPSFSFLSPFERFLCLMVSVLSDTGRGVPFIFW